MMHDLEYELLGGDGEKSFEGIFQSDGKFKYSEDLKNFSNKNRSTTWSQDSLTGFVKFRNRVFEYDPMNKYWIQSSPVKVKKPLLRKLTTEGMAFETGIFNSSYKGRSICIESMIYSLTNILNFAYYVFK